LFRPQHIFDQTWHPRNGSDIQPSPWDEVGEFGLIYGRTMTRFAEYVEFIRTKPYSLLADQMVGILIAPMIPGAERAFLELCNSYSDKFRDLSVSLAEGEY